MTKGTMVEQNEANAKDKVIKIGRHAKCRPCRTRHVGVGALKNICLNRFVGSVVSCGTDTACLSLAEFTAHTLAPARTGFRVLQGSVIK